MKKYSFLPILALVLGIAGSAFTSVRSSNPKTTQALYWFDEFGNYTQRQNTIEDEMDESGCHSQTTVLCEQGYEASDLVNPANPSLGVKSTAVADGRIDKD